MVSSEFRFSWVDSKNVVEKLLRIRSVNLRDPPKAVIFLTYLYSCVSCVFVEFIQGNGNRLFSTIESERQQPKLNEFKHADIKKRISNLTLEAEKITRRLVPEDSCVKKMSSSTSLNDTTSNYTEQLVETKFKEVTFKKQIKNAEPSFKETVNKNKIYSPRLYEEKEYPSQLSPSVLAVFNKQVFSPQKSSHSYNNKYLKHSCLENIDTIPSRPSSKGSSSVKTCKCGKNTLPLNKPIEKKIHTKKIDSQKSGLVKSKTQNITEYVHTYHDVSVNTDKPKYNNTSLVKMTSGYNDHLPETLPMPYQVQELPVINIRPNLTKQIGPVIDIKVPKTFTKKNNMAVIECIHPDYLHENNVRRSSSLSNNKVNRQIIQQNTYTPTVKPFKELKLQRSLNEMLKKLNEKGSSVDHLKSAINVLIQLLSKIVPFHSASIRLQNEDISLIDESIDLFFMNMDIVQEVIENELRNPIDQFCKYPEYILKAVNLLCGNIRSIFDVNESQPISVKPSINDYTDEKNNTPKSIKRQRKGNNKTSDNKAIINYHNKNIRHEPSKKNDTVIPKDVYIPYKKLIPGGLFKQMEPAESMSDTELRRKRLEKIHQINKTLKSGLSKNSKESSEEDQSSAVDKIADTLNNTFIIHSGDERKTNEIIENNSTKSSHEVKEKSDIDYEDDWEQDVATADSSSSEEPGRLEMKSIIVEAQVHHSYKISQNNSKSESLESLSNSQQNHLSVENPSVKLNSIAIQTEENIESSPIIINSEIQKNSNIPCTEKDKNLYVSEEVFPVLKMSNPLTHELLEVRLPSNIERFQSSVLFQKSQSKEEIKIFYNTNLDETIKHCDETVNISKQELSIEKDSHVTDNKDQNKEPSNDFENITTDFIGFLESKVTEMVNKFKSSETASEKLFTRSLVKQEGTKLPQYTFQYRNSTENLHSGLNSAAPLYTSAISLLSDKSAEELKFSKNVVSRGCSPGIEERKNFESLISPSLSLRLRKDAHSQTDDCTKNSMVDDACVGTSDTILPTTNDNLVEIHLDNNLQELPSSADEKVQCKEIVEFGLISPNYGLRWSSPDINITKADIPLSRLFPLPEEVLNGSNRNQSENSTAKATDPQGTQTIILQFKNLNHKETITLKNVHEKSNVNNEDREICRGAKVSLPYKRSPKEQLCNHEETTVNSPISDVGESKRTSQIFIALPATDSDITIRSPVPTKCDIQRITNEFSTLPDPMNFLQDTHSGDTSPRPTGTSNEFVTSSSVENEDYKEGFVIGDTNPRVTLSTNFDEKIQKQPADSRNTEQINPEFSGIDHGYLRMDKPSQTVKSISNSLPSYDKNIPLDKSNTDIEEVENHVIELDNLSVSDSDQNLTFNIDDRVDNVKLAIDDTLVTDSNYKDGHSNTWIINDRDASFQSNSSVASSEDHITIFHYNADEISDGEIGFISTSNSYSSGEIKPINQIKNVPIKSGECEIQSQRVSNEPVLYNSLSNTALHEDKENYIPGIIESSSTSGSISIGELRHLLDTDEKLDETTLVNLVDSDFLYSTRTSPEYQGTNVTP